MKRFLIITITTFLVLTNFFDNNATAQTKTDSLLKNDSVISKINENGNDPQEDDEFNLFLLVFATAFVSMILAGAVIGAFAAMLVLLLLFALVSMGILSASIIVGLYKRSFQTGFKTFLIIVCGIGGIVIGTVGFWLIVKIFQLDISNSTTTIAGAISGGLGGVILGIIVFKLILISTKYFKRRLNLAE